MHFAASFNLEGGRKIFFHEKDLWGAFFRNECHKINKEMGFIYKKCNKDKVLLLCSRLSGMRRILRMTYCCFTSVLACVKEGNLHSWLCWIISLFLASEITRIRGEIEGGRKIFFHEKDLWGVFFRNECHKINKEMGFIYKKKNATKISFYYYAVEYLEWEEF